jgi:hypothetical protein
MSRTRAGALLALALSCFVPAAALAAPKNLLSNPGFEESLPAHAWMPAGWDTSVSGLPSVFFGRDTLLAHGGRCCVDVANVSTLLYMAHNWSQRLIIGPEMWGKDLVFSVWTRNNGLTGRAYVMLQAYRDTISKMAAQWGVPRDSAQKILRIGIQDDPAIALGWNRLVFEEPETGWVRREVRVHVAPSTNAVFVRIGIFGTGQVLADDASLTLEPAKPVKSPRPGENLLANSGFEGRALDWEIAMPPYEGMRVEVDSTIAHSGRSSIRFESGAGEYVQARTGVCQAIDARGIAGKRVRLTGWIKTDSLRGSAYTKIYCHTMRGVGQVSQPEQFGGNTDWTKTTMEMDIPADTFVIWVWLSFDAPVPGIVHYDDARFEVIGGPKDPPGRMILRKM